MQVTAQTYGGRQWSYGGPGAGKVGTPPPANARLIARTVSMVGGTTAWWRVRRYVKSKEEVAKSSKGRSPFVLEVQDKPIPPDFQLPALEHYDGSSDRSKHITAFWAQMALYDTLDSLM
ncbi:hypothetical protein B296_00031900 [Ensete ventricosum]|uniref:Uncharacterized protein n=1 Tax=Ensete ventricosum TaxID=4639 RepID=A0A426Z9A6_ENSVE|nr:hypothetical protein B296_00031900 [Ensete ventricosum]